MGSFRFFFVLGTMLTFLCVQLGKVLLSIRLRPNRNFFFFFRNPSPDFVRLSEGKFGFIVPSVKLRTNRFFFFFFRNFSLGFFGTVLEVSFGCFAFVLSVRSRTNRFFFFLLGSSDSDQFQIGFRSVRFRSDRFQI